MVNRKNQNSIITCLRRLLLKATKSPKASKETESRTLKVSTEMLIEEINLHRSQLDQASDLVIAILEESKRRKTFSMDYVPIEFKTDSLESLETMDPLLKKLVSDYIGILNELNILLDFSYARQGAERMAPYQSLEVSILKYLINLQENQLKEAKEMNKLILKALTTPNQGTSFSWN